MLDQLYCYRVLALHAYRKGRRFICNVVVFW